MDLGHYFLQFVHPTSSRQYKYRHFIKTANLPRSRLWFHEMAADFVPVFLRHLALNTPLLDLVQPFVDRRVFLGIARKAGTVSPRREYRLKVEGLDLECVEHIARYVVVVWCYV